MSRYKRIINHTFESDNRFNCIFTAILGAAGAVAGAAITAGVASNNAKRANSTNKAIADQNLEYQKERNKIEDARYEEETAYNRAWATDERDYNRAWAEDEREYNRALQDEIFAREDTSYERTAQDMSNAGLNPLSMSGADGAGSVISSSTAPSAQSAPVPSARGGQALQNNFQYQKEESAQFLNSLITEIPHLCENFYKLDSMRQQAIGEKIKNMRDVGDVTKYFIDNGIKFNGGTKYNWETWDKGRWTYNHNWDVSKGIENFNLNQLKYYNQYLDTFRKSRDVDYDVDNGLFSSTSSLERTLTGISNVLTSGKLDEFTRATHNKDGTFDVGKAMRFLLLGALNGNKMGFNFN